jgi:hypothetical protein
MLFSVAKQADASLTTQIGQQRCKRWPRSHKRECRRMGSRHALRPRRRRTQPLIRRARSSIAPPPTAFRSGAHREAQAEAAEVHSWPGWAARMSSPKMRSIGCRRAAAQARRGTQASAVRGDVTVSRSWSPPYRYLLCRDQSVCSRENANSASFIKSEKSLSPPHQFGNKTNLVRGYRMV